MIESKHCGEKMERRKKKKVENKVKGGGKGQSEQKQEGGVLVNNRHKEFLYVLPLGEIVICQYCLHHITLRR